MSILCWYFSFWLRGNRFQSNELFMTLFRLSYHDPFLSLWLKIIHAISCSFYSFICLLTHSFTHLLIHSFTYSFVYSFVYSFIHLLIRSFTHLLIRLLLVYFLHRDRHLLPILMIFCFSSFFSVLIFYFLYS